MLQRRLGTVVKYRQALHKALRQAHTLGQAFDETLAALEGLLVQIDQQLTTLLNSLETLKNDARRLESMSDIGRQAATQLAVLFNRVSLANSDALVAFVGLDPRASDSGQKTGRRRLSKRGASELRRLLYNCAQAAAKLNFVSLIIPSLKPANFQRHKPWSLSPESCCGLHLRFGNNPAKNLTRKNTLLSMLCLTETIESQYERFKH